MTARRVRNQRTNICYALYESIEFGVKAQLAATSSYSVRAQIRARRQAKGAFEASFFTNM